MSDRRTVPYHAYEKRGQMIAERDKRIAELEAEQKAWRKLTDQANATIYKAEAKIERLRAVYEAAVKVRDGYDADTDCPFCSFNQLRYAIAEVEAALREDE